MAAESRKVLDYGNASQRRLRPRPRRVAALFFLVAGVLMGGYGLLLLVVVPVMAKSGSFGPIEAVGIAGVVVASVLLLMVARRLGRKRVR